MIKRRMLSAVLCILMLGMTSCGKGGSSQTTVTTTAVTTGDASVTLPDEAAVTTESSTASAEPELPKGNLNNLTGIYDLSDEAVGMRPVAVMINNIRKALPQYGIAAADILIECPVEGNLTRMMAVYADMTRIPDVCSIRSCRYYYPILALSYDAVYIHWGQDPTVAAETLKRLDVDRLNGMNNTYAFGRDEERRKTYSIEHTGYYKGGLTVSALDKAGIRKELLGGKDKPVFSFAEKPSAVSGTPCTGCNIVFSKSMESGFVYEDGVYRKLYNGDPHIDSSTGEQLSFTNVFVLGTETEIIDSKSGRLSMEWHGGDGYYISQGTIVPIKWSKADEFADIVLTDENGAELKVNPGKSYMGYTARLSSFTYEG